MRSIYAFKLFLFGFILTSFIAPAQMATSVTNGNWTNPLTWNCTCVPVNGYSVVINHTVSLNTSMAFNTGGITINNSGALIQDASLNRDILINGGYFNNGGLANFRFLAIPAGTISNAGSFTLTALSHTVSFNNSGSIKMDSMYMAGSFTNTATGKITGDSLLTANNLINNGNINIVWITNTGTFRNNNYQSGHSYTNAGNYQNYDSLILAGGLWNQGVFSNKTGAKFNIGQNFNNYTPAHTASFENNGIVKVLDSWFNTDTVKGNGSFTVADSSANSGVMKGTFDFCDFTPPASAPYVDQNSGSIGTGITWCLTTNIKEMKAKKQISIYPNPNNGTFVISGDVNNKESLTIINELGQEIKKVQFENGVARIEGLPAGIYFVKGNCFSQKIIVTK